MISNEITAQQIQEQLNAIAQTKTPLVEFDIHFSNNSLKEPVKKFKSGQIPVITGVLVSLSSEITPIQRLENFFQTIDFSLAVNKEYLDTVVTIMEEWCKSVAGVEVTQGDYAGVMNADMPFVGDLQPIAGIGICSVVTTTLNYQYIKNGVLSNMCVYSIDGTAFLATQSATNKYRNLPADQRENNQSLTTVAETQGLTFSLTLPYIKTQSILALVREIYSQEQLDTVHQLTYYDNAAFTVQSPISYNVIMREGTVSATAGSIPTIEVVFVIAQ